MNILVLMGGWSHERQVSLWTGEQVASGLTRLGYSVEKFILSRENVAQLVDQLSGIDLVFNALHGPGGEDGVIAGFLETLDVDYTHSGVFASALAMDKVATRNLVSLLGVKVPKGTLAPLDRFNVHGIEPPYVVKPRYEGSTIGVTIVKEAGSFDVSGWNFRGDPLIEEYIDGIELSVGLLDGATLGIVEIVPAGGSFFDFDAKYLDKGTRHVIPARLPPAVTEKAKLWSERIWKEIGCRDLARIDYRYDPARGDEGLYFLEVNTHPGLTATSLLPDIAKSLGMSFEILLERIVQNHAGGASRVTSNRAALGPMA